MKVGQLDNKAIAPATGDRKASASTPSAGTAKAEPSAKVELSATVSQLSADSLEGVFDANKVEKISNAIRDGKFEVNADAIADKLISNAQELLSNVTKR
ncbi:MAG: flagellar biosynthesis anti-sigma factor FlgM [Burkholderiales bacterium PBB5]|nr:MAG: flagellar biosynthesis anti-sigma factor FlgM [Burkholderiales bacterium PBB5]